MRAASLIPVDKLITWRKHVARKSATHRQFVESWYPEYFGFAPALYDSTDPAYKYLQEINTQLYESQVFCQDASHVEFASLSLLSPEYVSVLQKSAERAKAKRTAVENYNERVSQSQVGNARLAGRLGNIGNNLDKYDKPVREKRYRIQRFIQSEGLSRSAAVCNCGTNIGDFVHLKKNMEFGNVNVGGVATCGSVWACPVCRSKIINERQSDLTRLYNGAVNKGWKMHLLTFTFSHKKSDNLAQLYGSSSLRKGMSGAFTKFRQSRKWSKDLKNEIEYIGDVRTVEITWGFRNGFHPHIHLLLISKKNINIQEWENKLLTQWKKNCISSGIGEPNEHGLKIDKVNSVEMVEYLVKWGVASELQSDAAKQGKQGNFTIAKLESMLIDKAARKAYGMELKQVAGILRAYYRAMQGQKMLVYGGSNTGWRDELGIEAKTDQELTSEEYQAKDESHVCMMDAGLYREARRKQVFSDAIEEIESIDPYQKDYSVKVVNVLKKHFRAKKIPYGNKIWDHGTFTRKFQ